MRTVVIQHRPGIELDPVKAFKAGERLDRLLAKTLPPRPRAVWPMMHMAMNEQDLQWSLELARWVNESA